MCISCAEESQVGYGLVDDGELDIRFSDDLQVLTKTVPFDSVQTSNENTFFLGGIADPVFGEIKSSIFMNLAFRSAPSFGGGTFDSIFLLLPLNTSVALGSPDAVHNITVNELAESLPDSILSTDSFVTTNQIGGLTNLLLSELDTVRISTSDSTSIDYTNSILIPIDQEVGNRLFDNPDAHLDLESLRNVFEGVQVVSDSDKGILAIGGSSRIIVTYKDTVGLFASAEYFFALDDGFTVEYFQFSSIQRDFSGSQVASILNVPTSLSSPIYVQGLIGPVVEVDLSEINSLNNVIINHATIEFPVADILGRDTVMYPPAETLTLSTLVDGNFQSILDNDGTTFGGTLTFDEDRGISFYEMNITSHCTEILNGNESEVLYLRLNDGLVNPSSAILNGPNHPEFPVKLKITYTEL